MLDQVPRERLAEKPLAVIIIRPLLTKRFKSVSFSPNVSYGYSTSSSQTHLQCRVQGTWISKPTRIRNLEHRST